MHTLKFQSCEEQSLKSVRNWGTQEEFSTEPSTPNSGCLFHVPESPTLQEKMFSISLDCSTVTLLNLAKESILVYFEESGSSKNRCTI
ncbi:hypothetical protein AVEN_132365-1 [Araneus ventricosus]|uniref:Uncharacterized protein n=1 Tax=Araneus ventricosus TaxID=182803 RepID=A0A4Y2NDX9_ARAVE|nr:hypothetical protein AVEN_132365-1 [Araneus ventricosus]